MVESPLFYSQGVSPKLGCSAPLNLGGPRGISRGRIQWGPGSTRHTCIRCFARVLPTVYPHHIIPAIPLRAPNFENTTLFAEALSEKRLHPTRYPLFLGVSHRTL